MVMTLPPVTPAKPNFNQKAQDYLDWLAIHTAEENGLIAALTNLAAGTALNIPYIFSSATADADPGAGKLALDNATQNAATVIRCDLADSGGAAVTAILDTFDDSSSVIKGFVRLVKTTDASKWLIFSVSALASPAGYKNLTVSAVAGSSASPFVDGDPLVLLFTRTGDKGDTGTAGTYNENTANLGIKVWPSAATITGAYCGHALMSSGAYTLPDFTGSTKFNICSPVNAAAVPSTVTTSDGWTISTGFSAGTFKMLCPTSALTPHGTWGAATMTPPLLGTITGSAALTVDGTATIDTDLMAVLYHDATNFYVTAIKPSTGQVTAAPVTLCAFSSATYAAIYADSTSSYVAFASHAGGNATVRAGSINTGTLAITQGTAQTTGAALVDTPIKLANNTYFLAQSSASDLRAVQITSTTTVTIGTAVASGAQNTGVGTVKIARSSNTEALVGYLTNGGGTSATRGFSARIASVSGSTTTLQTASASATNTQKDAGLRCLLSYNDGASYAACIENGTTATTGNWYGITVSGTATTMGSVNTQTNNIPADFAAKTFIYQPARPIHKYDNTTMLFGHQAAGPIAVTISGSALTFGASGGPASAVSFMRDTSTNTNVYAAGASAFDKLSVSGTTITSAWQVAIAPTVVASDTITDKAVSYASTWYAWTLPTVQAVVTATKWLMSSGNNLIYTGPVS